MNHPRQTTQQKFPRLNEAAAWMEHQFRLAQNTLNRDWAIQIMDPIFGEPYIHQNTPRSKRKLAPQVSVAFFMLVPGVVYDMISKEWRFPESGDVFSKCRRYVNCMQDLVNDSQN